jgi:three-Cys-motif partner protein
MSRTAEMVKLCVKMYSIDVEGQGLVPSVRGCGMPENFFDEQSEQSQIKAAIVADYFWAWANVIIRVQKRFPQHAQKIGYIDLFAGPGRYQNGAASTPLLIMQRAVVDPDIRERLVTILNDKDEANTDSLRREIQAIPGIKTLKFAPMVETGEVGENIIRQFQSMKLIPTFLFVDPFGYKGLSLELVNSVLRDWGCDCVFFFNYNRISMGLGNDAVEKHMDALFGKPRADALRARFGMQSMSPAEREAFIVEEMMNALKEMGGQFVLPFRFRNAAGSRTTHHLFFVSKHFRGYEIMRDVMYKHSHKDLAAARFEYNPATASCPSLFELLRPLGELEDLLLADCAGRTFVIRQLFESHSVGKPFVLKNYREVLLRMEGEGKVKMDPPCPPRRRNTLAEHVKITFPGRAS